MVDAPTARAPGAFYRPELDGLRFFAFLAVYVNHTVLFGVEGHHQHLPDWFAHLLGTIGTAGAFGVDLFFVLSAYLITELLLRERRASGTLGVRAFYLRRALRIWPLYFAFLALAFALTFVVPSERLTPSHLAAFLLFSGNWMYMTHPVATVAAPLWSVSVEEQFYLAWPWAVRRGSVRRIAAIASGMIVVGLVGRCWLSLQGVAERIIWLNSFTRVDGIACGVLLAVALDGRIPRLGGAARGAIALASLAVTLWVAGDFGLFEGPTSVLRVTLGWLVVAVACAFLVFAALGSSGLVGAPLRNPVVVYLGRISYGLYVFHQLGLLVVRQVFPDHATRMVQWAGYTCVGLALTVGMAAASYRWLEKPFLRIKRRFTVVASRPDAQ